MRSCKLDFDIDRLYPEGDFVLIVLNLNPMELGINHVNGQNTCFKIKRRVLADSIRGTNDLQSKYVCLL